MSGAISALFGLKKTPDELISSSQKHLDVLEASENDSEEYIHSIEKLSKHLSVIKRNLLGDGDVEADEAVKNATVTELLKPEFFHRLVNNLGKFEFEAKKDTSAIFNFAMKALVKKGAPTEMLDANPNILLRLVELCDVSDTALHSGIMLRECARSEAIAMHLLTMKTAAAIQTEIDSGVPQPAVFFEFFRLVQNANFDLASDAFETFKYLLTKHKAPVAKYLEANYDAIFGEFNGLIQSDNYVVKRQSIKLLSEVILDRSNFVVMMRYINDADNLMMLMRLLKGSSKTIQAEAFHVFKVFVANPNKSDGVNAIFKANRDRLITFLKAFKLEKETEQFVEEKSILLATLEKIEVSAADAPSASSLGRHDSSDGSAASSSPAAPSSS